MQPAPQEFPPIAWSWSALSGYETCPKRHWHTRVAKDVSEDGESTAMAHGKRVHKSLENRLMHNVPLPLDLTYAEVFCKKLTNAPGKLHGEQKLAVDFDMKPCDWFDPKCYIRAIMDAAVINGTNAVLIDWKTGKMSPDITQLRLASMLLFMHIPELETVTGAFIWLKSKELTQSKMARKDIPEFWNFILPRVQNLARAKALTEYPARPGGLCRRYCPVSNCPHHGI